jgi:hypothetical protein
MLSWIFLINSFQPTEIWCASFQVKKEHKTVIREGRRDRDYHIGGYTNSDTPTLN